MQIRAESLEVKAQSTEVGQTRLESGQVKAAIKGGWLRDGEVGTLV